MSPTRYARSSGAKIAYRVTGTGPVDMVMVPGLLSHLELDWQNPSYRRFSVSLARACRLIQFDKRGTGLSDPTAGLPPIAERVDDLLAVLAAARSRRAVVFALSEGTRAAIALAVAHPERILGLVLYGTEDHSPPQTRRMRALQSALAHWGEGRILGIYAPSIATAEMRQRAGAFERAAASPAMAPALIGTLGLHDVRDRLAALTVPTLVLHRQDDVIPVDHGRAVAARIPTARLVVLPGRDHLPWVGDWAAVVAQVLAFVADVAPASAASAPATPATRRSAARPKLGWPSLTPSERDVVGLVAEGLSNRQIAERLFISRYTVETHLKHVFAKLMVESRVELAALAVAEAKTT
ncbi:MAG: alpha/beta fold hydrolase [Chloroflexota bacterium]|nr:alpha/beta fold hydrolase [Chloroflexota bacterium]